MPTIIHFFPLLLLTPQKPGLPVADKKSSTDRPNISTAWDVSYEDAVEAPMSKKKKRGKRSRRNSISDADISQGEFGKISLTSIN